MQPNGPAPSNPQPSLDDVQVPVRSAPEYRYDHELPAPEQVDKLAATTQPTIPPNPITAPKPIHDYPEPPKKRSSIGKKLLIVGVVLLVLLVLALGGMYAWYQQQLSPASSDTKERVRISIEKGETPAEIASQLQIKGVIRSEQAFLFYTKLTGVQDSLKAGVYNLQPSVSTPAIVEHLVSGKQDTYRITFLPGDTLANNRKKLLAVGFGEQEIDAALNKHYDRLLFSDKPAGTDLEGYIFGDTYEFDESTSVEGVLARTFDEFEDVIRENDLVNGFRKQGLSLYEGITLSSIVQREVSSPNPGLASEDQKQVARVFLNRMAAGMTLGSDVTYQYIADKTGVTRDPSLDSPYNTRRYPGLPPGPIATPGAGALKAVASPGVNDYLFFLSGDDDVTYFAKTDAEHQKNIVSHCQKKCLIN